MEALLGIRDFLQSVGPHVVAALTLFISIAASAHVVLYKRDTRSAVGWVGLIWLVPVVGAVLYVLLGINRIRRKARALRAAQEGPVLSEACIGEPGECLCRGLGREYEHLEALEHLMGRITGRPLLAGNAVEYLVDGDEAFPAMLEAIAGARRTVALQTYIFDNDRAGRLFMDALAGAVGRGVDVRVILDAVGARYSLPPVTRKLRKLGVRVARFLPTVVPWRLPFMNLRNHRKLLVVDGQMGFTGGMNIRHGLMLGEGPRHPLHDLHFRLRGPVVAHLQETFAADWSFCTGQKLDGTDWFPPVEPAGQAMARGIPDGPDEDFEKQLWTMQGALSVARRSVVIMTPYFLPDHALITSLNLAAMRGVEVDIIMPSVNNLPFVKWAATHQLWQIMQNGCRVWLTPPPFDHSKLMLVDGAWMHFGSGNWDPRSFRLNFEFNVECYDPGLARRLGGFMRERMKEGRQVSLEEVDRRSLAVKLRDGAMRLWAPYL